MNGCGMKLLVTAGFLAMVGGMAGTAWATETENQNLHVLPAPGNVVIDGKTDDWDLSGGLFACGELEHLRDEFAVWVHGMYDAENLYIVARWKDPTPLNNPEGVGGHAFNGDCIQLRFILFPGTPEQTVTWWDCWRDKNGKSIAGRAWPGEKNGIKDNPVESLPDAQERGVKQAFEVSADGKGYIQEIAIPWKLLSVSGRALKAGERMNMTVEPNFTAGAFGRITIKDLFNDQVAKPDRIFTFRAFKHWGWATLQAKGNMTPAPVRVADGRTFSVSMAQGAPVVDWTGLVRKFEWPGFKAITFDMPMDGYISLNILNQEGRPVRHLLNWDQRNKGSYTVQWDGLSDATYRTPGQPLPAGTYTWKAIAHPGAKLSFRGYASYGGSTPWHAGPTSCWLGDHGVPTAVITDGQNMYLACNGAEGGRHLLKTDFDGNVVWGLQNTAAEADPESIAVDNGFVYVLHPVRTGSIITRVDTKAGTYANWEGKKDFRLAAKDIYGQGQQGPTQFKAIDARAGRIYLTSADTLVILDGATGKLVKTWPLQTAAGAVKAVDDHLVYIISGGTSILALDPTNGQSKPFIEKLGKATGLNTDSVGNLYVSLDAPDMQVVVFDAQGKELKRIGRNGGRAPIGAWQADGMFHPAGVAVDKLGKLWVMERDPHPKRVSLWSLADGKFIKDFFGPTQYGAAGSAINPRDPNLMVGVGCEWRLDPATGKSVCLGTFDHQYHGFATFREGSNGKLYLFTHSGRYGTGTLHVWERLGDANYAKRAELRVEGAGSVLWVDANGDGKEQSDELQSLPTQLLPCGSNGWSLNLGPDMTIYPFDSKAKRLVALSIDGFTASGAPKYDLTKLKVMPEAVSAGYASNYSCAVPSADNKRILINLVAKNHPAGYLWTCFDLASGQQVWTYPNPFFQVHGSHAAPAPDPGLFRGAYGPVGTATLPGAGNVWFINGNVGEWGVLSSEGFYVTRLFNGNVFDWNWPQTAAPGADMTNLPPGSGGEDFGGSVTQAKDGQVYVQSGKAGIWNVLLTGLDKTVEIPGSKIVLAKEDLPKAMAFRDQAMQSSAGGHKLTVKQATVKLTGKFAEDFKGCEIVEYEKSAESTARTALAHDDTMLYIGWEVKDTTPWVNGSTDIAQLYAGGDTVDLQLGTDASADAKRGKAAKGDIRLSIGNFQGKPTAVLYRFISDDKKPRTFTSGVVRGYQVDYVDVLSDAKIEVKPGNGQYIVEVAVPLAALGLKLTPGLTLPGDIGVTFNEASGTRTKLRSHWANQQTGLVDDVVIELQLTPQNWGTLTFE